MEGWVDLGVGYREMVHLSVTSTLVLSDASAIYWRRKVLALTLAGRLKMTDMKLAQKRHTFEATEYIEQV